MLLIEHPACVSYQL